MAFNKTLYLRKKILDHFMGKSSYTFPTVLYMALFTADPTESGSLTNEMTGSNYSRLNIVTLLASADLTTGTIQNNSVITFAAASADWPAITHGALMDASTSGNMLWFGASATSRVISNGDNYRIGIGQLLITDT